MEIIITINNCAECRYRDHSGYFTKGGAKDICGHTNAVDTFVVASTSVCEDKYHWKHRVLHNLYNIPENCPLKNGYKY